jgi:site-specific DNA recombinase
MVDLTSVRYWNLRVWMIGLMPKAGQSLFEAVRGHRMTPSHARRRGIKYRYYISSALLQGRPKQAGTVNRIPAREVEALVIKAVRDRLNETTEIADTLLIQNHVTQIEVQSDKLVIELADAVGIGSKRKRKSRNTIEVPWRKTPPTRRREILVPESAVPQKLRPIRSENRALLVASIARGRRWLDGLQHVMVTHSNRVSA